MKFGKEQGDEHHVVVDDYGGVARLLDVGSGAERPTDVTDM